MTVANLSSKQKLLASHSITLPNGDKMEIEIIQEDDNILIGELQFDTSGTPVKVLWNAYCDGRYVGSINCPNNDPTVDCRSNPPRIYCRS